MHRAGWRPTGAKAAGPGRNEPCPCGSGIKYKHCCAAAGVKPQPKAGQVEPSPAAAGLDQIRTLRDAGRLLEAGRLAQQHLAATGPDAAACAELGLVHLHAGRSAEALGFLARAARLAPAEACHHYWCGIALETLGRDAEAMTAFRTAIRCDADHVDALERLGNLLRVHERQQGARDCFARAAAVAPDTAKGRMNRVKAMQEDGQRAETEAVLRDTVALFPDHCEARRALASVLREQGRFDEALPLLEAATAGIPAEAAAAYFDLVSSKKVVPDDLPMIEQMLALLAYRPLPEIARQWVHFGLGKAYDDLDRPAEAMQQFEAGNALVAQRRPFDRSRFGASVHRVIASTDRAFFDEHRDAGSSSGLPVLVLGMPRSGTTLVEQILSSHRHVAAGDELPFWNRAAEGIARDGEALTPARLHTLAHDYETLLRGVDADALRVTDKTPGNFLWLGLFHLAFPHGRIIHCRRHPVDTCLSNYFTNFMAPMAYTYDKGHLAFYYRTYRRLMEHWQAVLPREVFHCVDYEELVADPETVTRRMIEFLGLEWDEACLRPERNRRVIRTASQWQVRQPTHRGSVARWRRYEPWLGELRTLLPGGEPAPAVHPQSDNPALPRARRLREAGRLDEAIDCMQQAVRRSPHDPMLLNELGTLHLAADRIAEAVDCLERAIGLEPDFAVAHYNHSAALERQGQPAAAIASLRRALAAAPELGAAHSRLGNLLQAQGAHADALDCFRRARSLLPRPADQRLEEAKLLRAEGSADTENRLREVVSLDPENAMAHAMLGDLLGECGRFDEAVLHLQQAIACDPDRVGALFNIVLFKRLREEDRPMLARMEAMLEQPGRSEHDRTLLHFALAKAHDDLGEPAQAMAHLEPANAAEHRGTSFDRDAMAARVDALIAGDPPGNVATLASGLSSERPVLILGMPRSGTTLVEQILSAHPAVAAGGELTFWTDRADGGMAGTAAAVAAAACDYLAMLARISPDALRVTDKNPFNFLTIGLVRAALPQARFIHCRRDPVDTCLSIFFTRFATPQHFAYHRDDLVFFYRQYRRLMRHWRAVLPADQLLEVDYEALTAELDAQARRMVAFCGLDWDQACLAPERNARPIRTASVWQARQAIHRDSVARWRRYEPWLGTLRALHDDADGGRAA